MASVILAPLSLAACATGEEKDRQIVRVWVVGKDTPQEARDYLKTTFEQDYENVTLVVEEQSWDGLVNHLKESMSGDNGPDVVEIGNTQAPALTSEGYLRALSDEEFAELGGGDLLPEFVAVGDWNDRHYAVPYYASVRIVYYSPSLTGPFDIPETLDDYVTTAESLTTPDRSGLYWPGRDWYNVLPFIWENGGYIAERGEDGEWRAGFSSEGGIAGLRQVQQLMTTASHAGKSANERDLQGPFCAGEAALVSTTSGFPSMVQSTTATDSCPRTYGNDLTAFALPSKSGDGPAQVFGGGSNLGISATTDDPELAFGALNIMLGNKYQSILGSHNLVPAKVSLAATVPQGSAIARASVNAAANSRLTPATPRWAEVESQEIVQSAMVRIAHGEDVVVVANELDEQIEKILND